MSKELLQQADKFKGLGPVTAIESNLIRLVHALADEVGRKEWQPIATAPMDIPIMGKCVFEPDEEQKKGVREGWLGLPNALPFICKLVPESEKYNKACVTLDMYGDEENDDAVYPTHWQPLPLKDK